MNLRRWLSRKMALAAIWLVRQGEAILPPHPYAADIAACRRPGVWVNNSAWGCSFDEGYGRQALPDGELGPQCDHYRPEHGDKAVGQDDRWLYLKDGRRLPIRQGVTGRLN